MNCANHPDRERSAFCQNCGKPLCTECVRTVGNSIFCEPCLVVRTTTPPGPGVYPPPPPSGEPSPGLAALLGFIPGVGAMYNGQYAKGIVHLVVFAVLVSLAHENGIFGLFIMGWVLYMVIEAHHTAKARRDGTPLPNPFGLNDLSERLGFGKAWPTPPGGAPYTNFGGFNAGAPTPDNPNPTGAGPFDPIPGAPTSTGANVPPTNPYSQPPYNYTYVPPVSSWGAPQEGYGVPPIPPIPPVPPMPPYPDPNASAISRIPTGAIWLIGLGVLFLLSGNTGIFYFHGRVIGPLLLIAVGVWLFVRRMLATGHGLENDGTPTYSWRLFCAARGSIWMVVIGIIWLLDAVNILHWNSSWPLLMILGGVMLFLKRAMLGSAPYPYGYPPYPGATPPTTPPVTTTAIVPTHDSSIIREEGK